MTKISFKIKTVGFTVAILALATLAPVSTEAATLEDENQVAEFCRTLSGGSASDRFGYCAFTAPGASAPCVVSSQGSFPVFSETCETRQLSDLVGQDDEELRERIMGTGGTPTQAGGSTPRTRSTSAGNSDVNEYLATGINILVGVAGLAIVGSIVVGGIQYSSAGGNASQVSSAKNRIVVSIASLLILGFGYAILQWLVPGGIFN